MWGEGDALTCTDGTQHQIDVNLYCLIRETPVKQCMKGGREIHLKTSGETEKDGWMNGDGGVKGTGETERETGTQHRERDRNTAQRERQEHRTAQRERQEHSTARETGTQDRERDGNTGQSEGCSVRG